MDFVNNNQVFLLTACFVLGLAATLLCMRKSQSGILWQVADLSWLVFGGFGALTAILAGLYQDDSLRLDRQIDVAYAASNDFDQDAGRFRLRYCDHQIYPADDLRHLCEKVEFLSASTASNAALPLFISLTQNATQRRAIYLFSPATTADEALDEQIQELNMDSFLTFSTMEPETLAATSSLRARAPQISADFLILSRAYDELISQVQRLKQEYDLLEANSGILSLQIMGLCLVALTAPFRLGKSVVDLRKARQRRRQRLAPKDGTHESDQSADQRPDQS